MGGILTLAGDLKPEAIITSKITLHKVEQKGFKTLVDDKDNHVKILVKNVCP